MEFDEFSFWDKDGSLSGKDITNAQRNALYNLLNKEYGAI